MVDLLGDISDTVDSDIKKVDVVFFVETNGKNKRRVTIPHYVMEDLLLLAKVKKSQLDEIGDEREWKGHVFYSQVI